jgi:hypothetical protein
VVLEAIKPSRRHSLLRGNMREEEKGKGGERGESGVIGGIEGDSILYCLLLIP